MEVIAQFKLLLSSQWFLIQPAICCFLFSICLIWPFTTIYSNFSPLIGTGPWISDTIIGSVFLVFLVSSMSAGTLLCDYTQNDTRLSSMASFIAATFLMSMTSSGWLLNPLLLYYVHTHIHAHTHKEHPVLQASIASLCKWWKKLY